MIKLVIFDAGDILYDWEEAFKSFDEEVRKFFEKHNVKLQEDYRKLWNTENIGIAATTGKISLQKAHKRHLELLGMSDEFLSEYEEIDKKMLKKLKLKDLEAKEAIQELKRKGYKVAILSDTPHTPDTHEMILQTIGLDGLFDGVFLSSQTGHMKPDKEAYLKVLHSFELQPSDAVFVAHDEDELIGAKKVGIKTISYRNLKSGDFVVQSLKEIPQILEKL